MSSNFKTHENAFYGLNVHSPVRISKNIFEQMVLSCSPWPLFLIAFAQRLWLEFKQLHDTDGQIDSLNSNHQVAL